MTRSYCSGRVGTTRGGNSAFIGVKHYARRGIRVNRAQTRAMPPSETQWPRRRRRLGLFQQPARGARWAPARAERSVLGPQVIPNAIEESWAVLLSQRDEVA